MQIEVQTRKAEDRLDELNKIIYLKEQELGALHSRISQATFSFRGLDREASVASSQLAVTSKSLETVQAQYEKEKEEKLTLLWEAKKTLSRTKREFELGKKLIEDQEDIISKQERGLFWLTEKKVEYGRLKVSLMKLKWEYDQVVASMDSMNQSMVDTESYINKMNMDLDTRMDRLRKAQMLLNDKEQQLNQREAVIAEKELELNINLWEHEQSTSNE